MTDQDPKGIKLLTDEQMDSIAGGYIVDRGEKFYGLNSRYFIIDDVTGEYLRGSDHENYAVTIADAKNVSQQFITFDEYKEIFGKEFPYLH